MRARSFMLAVVCLFAGLLVGRLAPLADLRRVEAELAEAKAGPGRRTPSEAAVTGVRSMLQVSDQDMDKARRIRRARELMTNEAMAEVSAVVETNGAEGAVASTSRVEVVRDRSSLSNSIQHLKKGWDMRRDLARNNLIRQLELPETSVNRFDVLVEAMNLRLGATVDAWSTKLLEQGSVNEEDGLRMMNELSEAMVLTYDEMDRTMPEGWREKVGPKFDLMRFIDPEVLTPLQDLEDIEDHTEDDADAEWENQDTP
jgi:hypothetical protein